MTKPTEFLSKLVGCWHTEHYLAAVIDDLNEAERAVSELEQAGWNAHEVRLFRGASAVQTTDMAACHPGLPARIAAAVRRATSEEGPISAVYEAEAKRGHQILTVYAPGPAEVARASQVLARHQAHSIEYFGGWVITDLPALEDLQPYV
jgi:hypothetical protein